MKTIIKREKIVKLYGSKFNRIVIDTESDILVNKIESIVAEWKEQKMRKILNRIREKVEKAHEMYKAVEELTAKQNEPKTCDNCSYREDTSIEGVFYCTYFNQWGDDSEPCSHWIEIG